MVREGCGGRGGNWGRGAEAGLAEFEELGEATTGAVVSGGAGAEAGGAMTEATGTGTGGGVGSIEAGGARLRGGVGV